MKKKEEWNEEKRTKGTPRIDAIETQKERGKSLLNDKKCGNKRGRIGYILLAVAIGIASFFGGMMAYKYSLDKELRTLIKLKDKIQSSYYEEVTDEAFYGAIFAAISERNENGEIQSEEDFYKTVFDAVNNDVLDIYSEYMTAEKYAETLIQSTGVQSGVGLYFLANSESLLVKRVSGNSPAEKAGLEVDDVITGFGKSPDAFTTCDKRSQLVAFLKEVGLVEEFYLQWRTPSGEIRSGALKRSIYIENYVYYKTNAHSYGFEGDLLFTEKTVGSPFTFLDDDTAYIRLTQFNGNATGAFDKAMSLFQAEKKKDLVLDLRGNGGGYMDILSGIAKYFCKNSTEKFPVVAIADYGEEKQNFYAQANVYYNYFTEDSRITVLADDMTASASEGLIGCMYAYGTIAYEDICLVEKENGEAKTYGKGIMQTTYTLNGEREAVKLTTARIFWPTKEEYCIHDRGVTKADGTATVSEALSFEVQARSAIETLYS